MPTKNAARKYWLLKSEPDCFSFDDLLAAPKRRTGWDGVRNFQARNSLRDEMAVGDGVLFYHSSASPAGIAGIARVVRAGYPDPTQFDPASDHFDARSRPAAPTWFQVDVEAVEKCPRFVTLDDLKQEPKLSAMKVLQRGQRLSVMPVAPAEWSVVLRLSGCSRAAV